MSSIGAVLTSIAMATFTIVVIPDTQKLTSNSASGEYTDLIQYILDEKEARNIQMVIHTGDTVDDGGDSGMNAEAGAALSLLEGEIPYIIGIGNKDYDDGGGTSRAATGFNGNFPLATYQTYDWFIDDVYPSGETVNAAAKITVGDYTYLFISIEFLPRTAAIEWAQGIVDSNTDADLIIVNSHFVLDSDGDRAPDSEVSALWDDFITQNDKIQLVLSGHVQGPRRRTDNGIHQHLHNEQDQAGNDYQDSAYIRFYEVDQTDHSVSVTTYNPLTDDQLTDSENQFTFSLSVEPAVGGEGGGEEVGGGAIMGGMASYTATVNASKVAATHSNFRAWVDLSSLSLTDAQLNSVRVYSDSGLTTELAREVINGGGKKGFWVKITSLTTSTVLYIEIDGTSSDYAATDTYGRNNVWTGYLAVNHAMSGDSTGNSRDFGAGGGATLAGATGVAGPATALDGVNDYAQIAYDAGFNFGTGDATMELIAKSPNASALQHLLTYGNRDSWTAADSFCMEITSGNEFNSKIRPSGSGAEATGGAFSVDTWYKLKAVADRDGNLTLYANGTAVATTSISALAGGSLNEATVGFIFGANNGLSTFAELTGCEFRVKTSIDSDHGNLETTEYNNVLDNSNFWTLASDNITATLTAAVDGSASISTAITFAQSLAAAVDGSATVNNIKSLYRTIVAAVDGSATIGSVNVIKQALTAAVNATVTITKESINTVQMVATATAEATITTIKSFKRTLTGNVDGSATVSKALSLYRTMVANVSGSATVSATKTFFQNLTASVQATATVVRGSVIFGVALSAIISVKAKLNEYFYKQKYESEDEDYKRKY